MNMKLVAGIPNDANRDYVPLAIKGSLMTVNENGNNSQVYPNLLECTGILADGLEDRWYEYVPASYDGSKPVPLVVSNHGGMMNGWAQSVYSSWTMLADREGFICVFPDCHALQMWTLQGMAARVRQNPELVLPIPVDPEDYRENHDMNYVRALIAHMQEKYCIDSGRIYMQGMSMGHMMTDQFARYYGDILAGAAGSGASCIEFDIYNPDGSIRNVAGPVPMWISHPEKNGMDASFELENIAQKHSRDYWREVNACHTAPRISIIGEDNFAFFTGEKADLVYLDIKNRDHGQALDEAFYYWNYMFSGLRRNPDGSITRSETLLSAAGDAFALAFADGSAQYWKDNRVCDMGNAAQLWQKLKYHGLNGGTMVRGEYLCVPVRVLADAFGAGYETNAEGTEAVVTLKDGRKVQFARGIIGCLVDENLYAMYCEALHRNGELLVSVEWFCRFLMNMTVSACGGVVYVTDHFAELSEYMAALIREQLDRK